MSDDARPRLPASIKNELVDILVGPTEERRGKLSGLCRKYPDEAEQIRKWFEEQGVVVAAAAETPERIDNYRILEVLGEGGMGTVYLAEQETPVHRRVALKVIKLGMDTRQVIARFEAERQALALMDHPNIAKVFDAGTTDEGRPYFVMEYMPWAPITEFADRAKLGVVERLDLFVQVCRGVQHAHQKGIIHRDIKPANILVQTKDDRAVPILIDFGIAKATDRRLTDQTYATLHGSVIGTPEYMSPEQADMNRVDIDTRTDVYSLGVVLYELLTGQLPFDAEELRKASPSELQHKICEVDPPKPSTRLGTHEETTRSMAARRGTDVRSLRRSIRGDLDWITMKALEKEPARRYQTAAEMASDLERHRRDEPVEASPPSTWYRVRKFVRRYRGRVTAGAAVLLALLVGLVTSTALYFDVQAAREREGKAHGEALSRAEEARRVTDFMVDLFRHASPDRSLGEDVPVRLLLQQGEQRIRQELGDHPARAQLLASFGRVYYWLGSYDKAERFLADAIESRLARPDPYADRNLVGWRVTLANTLVALGRADEAEEICRDTLQQVEEHGIPAVGECVRVLGDIQRYQGRLQEAGANLRRAVALGRGPERSDLGLSRSTSALARLLHDTFRTEEARPLFEEALRLQERLHPKGHPELIHVRRGLSRCLTALGVHAEAEKTIRAALAEAKRIFGAEHPVVAGVVRDYAHVVGAAGRSEEAERLLREALAMSERLPGARRNLAWALNDLATGLLAHNENREARDLLERAVETYEKIFPDGHVHLAICLSNSADAHLRLGELLKAEKRAAQSVAMLRRLESTGLQLALGLRRLGQVLSRRGRQDEAVNCFREAIASLDESAEEWTLGQLHKNLAWVYVQQRKAVEAERAAQEALEHLRRARTGDSMSIAVSEYYLAWALYRQKRTEEAEVLCEEAVATMRRLFPAGRPEMAFALSLLGSLRIEERPAEALVLFRDALEIRRRTLLPQAPMLLESVYYLGMALLKSKEFDEAERLLLETLAGAERAGARGTPYRTAALKGLVELYTGWEKPERKQQYEAMLTGK